MTEALGNIAAYLLANDGFTILAHVSPDGDTLGSSLALLCALKNLGKSAQVVCENAVPHVYAFLPGAQSIVKPAAAKEYPNAVAVDCAAPDRLGAALPLFAAAAHTVCIDHHITNAGYAQENCIVDTAATGELVYALLTMLDALDAEAATCLYTALMTDTGNFSYSNTTSDTLRTAAELMDAGADNAYISGLIYRNVPYPKTRLLGTALSGIRLLCGGRLGVAVITQADMREVNANSEDVEGIIDHVRDIEGVEMAMVIRESSEKDTGKVSLRSKQAVDVSKIARGMAGGGHVRAAGYTDHGPFEEICARAIALAQDALRTE